MYEQQTHICTGGYFRICFELHTELNFDFTRRNEAVLAGRCAHLKVGLCAIQPIDNALRWFGAKKMNCPQDLPIHFHLIINKWCAETGSRFDDVSTLCSSLCHYCMKISWSTRIGIIYVWQVILSYAKVHRCARHQRDVIEFIVIVSRRVIHARIRYTSFGLHSCRCRNSHRNISDRMHRAICIESSAQIIITGMNKTAKWFNWNIIEQQSIGVVRPAKRKLERIM